MRYTYTRITLSLIVSVIVFLLPFLFGILFVFLSSIGITPSWGESEVHIDLSVFSNPIYRSQLLLAFIRANSIGIVVFVLVFLLGYLISLNVHNASVQMYRYFLSIPHVSLALGFLILMMPSGILFRIIAIITGTHEVGDVSLVNDALGIGMSVVVIIKLTAFVVFIMVAALQDYYLQYQVLQSKLLRHNKFQTWLFIIFPQIMPRIFVPFLISISYAIAPIDIATILGPRFPSSIGLEIYHLFGQVSRNYFIDANMLCIALGIITIVSLFLWYGIFHGIRAFLRRGYSMPHAIKVKEKNVEHIARGSVMGISGIVVISTLLLLLWSFVIRWDFPDMIPSKMGIAPQLSFLSRFNGAITNSIIIMIVTVLVSCIIAIAILEMLNSLHWQFNFITIGMLLSPLMLPSIVYITGVHIFFLYLGINGTLFAVVWAHALKVVPYMVLLLYGVFKTYNSYYELQARVLGKRYTTVLCTIKLPMLMVSIGYAILIGCLVCVAEYVHTQFIGEGKWETVTILSIALSSGGNRQIVSIAGILLTLLNFSILMVSVLFERMQKGYTKVRL